MSSIDTRTFDVFCELICMLPPDQLARSKINFSTHGHRDCFTVLQEQAELRTADPLRKDYDQQHKGVRFATTQGGSFRFYRVRKVHMPKGLS